MAETREPFDEQFEEIVAYLDGELSSEERARVERRLGSDEAFRRQVQSAERVWQALDELPATRVDDRFSRTTMEMAVQTAAGEVAARTLALPQLKRRRKLSTTLAGAAVAALAFLAVRLALRDPNRNLLVDLPEIAAVDAYAQFDDVAFLRELDKRMGDRLVPSGEKGEATAARTAQLVAIENSKDRGALLGEMSPEEQTELRSKSNRFADLSGDAQDRLRKLHAEVATANDAPQLFKTMIAYQQWLGGLSAARQYELRRMSVDERLRTIETWSREMEDDAALALTPEELRKFGEAVRQIRLAARKEVFKNPPGGPGEAPGRRPPRFGSGGPMRPFGGQQSLRELWINNDYSGKILAALPERVRERFSELSPDEKFERLWTWMRQADANAGNVSQAELERFFAEDLPVEMRAELLALPADEMEVKLTQLYRRQQPERGFGFGGGPWGERGGPRGPWGQGRGGPPRGPRDEFGGPRGGFGPPPPRDDRERRPGPPRPGEGFGGPDDRRGFGPPPEGGPEWDGGPPDGKGPPPGPPPQ